MEPPSPQIPGLCSQAKEKKGKPEKGKEKVRPKEKKGKGARKVDKGLLAQRRLEERRRQQLILEEMKKPTEDMCLGDHQVGWALQRDLGAAGRAEPTGREPGWCLACPDCPLSCPAAAAGLLPHPGPRPAQPRFLQLPDRRGVPAELRQGPGLRPGQGRAQPVHAAGGAAGGGGQRGRGAGPAGEAAAGCALRPRAAPLLPGERLRPRPCPRVHCHTQAAGLLVPTRLLCCAPGGAVLAAASPASPRAPPVPNLILGHPWARPLSSLGFPSSAVGVPVLFFFFPSC